MAAEPESGSKFAPWADPSAQAYVKLDRVTRKFGDFVAVDDVSLEIYQREFFALLGPSGCGKTTLLRILAGFEIPDSGTIEIDGAEMSTVPPYRRPVNMMFQSYALFPHMDVATNIAFGLKQDKVPASEIAQRVEEVVELVQLGPFVRRKPHQLSGGQRQRVALARSLVKKPKLLLLDEPLGALDKKLRQQTQFELMDLQEKLGMTFVIVTHDQEEAMTVASRIAVMNRGRFEQIASPSEMYEYPASRYVASFLGEVNMLECRVSSVDAASGQLGLRIRDSDQTLRLSGNGSWFEGDQACLAVRPEKLRIAAGHLEGNNHLHGVVEDIGYLGSLSTYHVRVNPGLLLTVSKANEKRLVDRGFTWGQSVTLAIDDGAGVLLDR